MEMKTWTMTEMMNNTWTWWWLMKNFRNLMKFWRDFVWERRGNAYQLREKERFCEKIIDTALFLKPTRDLRSSASALMSRSTVSLFWRWSANPKYMAVKKTFQLSLALERQHLTQILKLAPIKCHCRLSARSKNWTMKKPSSSAQIFNFLTKILSKPIKFIYSI